MSGGGDVGIRRIQFDPLAVGEVAHGVGVEAHDGEEPRGDVGRVEQRGRSVEGGCGVRIGARIGQVTASATANGPDLGAPQRGEVTADAEVGAEVAGERADVGARGAHDRARRDRSSPAVATRREHLEARGS